MSKRSDLRAKIASLIDCAGGARRRAGAYRADARTYPRETNKLLSDAARNVENARWYLRLARDRREDLAGAA